jgi:hypothetical protein
MDPTMTNAENTGLSNLTYPAGHLPSLVEPSSDGTQVCDKIFISENIMHPKISLPLKNTGAVPFTIFNYETVVLLKLPP